MDPFTILMLASAASSIIGSISQGNSEREQAKQDARRQKAQMDLQNQQLDWQIEDQTKGRDAAEGSLLASTSALGVGGASIDMMRGQTIGEYNRAIYQSQQQKDQVGLQQGYLNQDLADFQKQSRFNEAVGIGTSLLSTGVSYYSHKAQLDLDKKFKGLGIE